MRIAITLAAVAAVGLTRPVYSLDSASGPAEGIEWRYCAQDADVSTQCGTLQVRLNYTNDSNGEKIEVPVYRIRAVKNPKRGSIIFNPGGPGSPGMNSFDGNGIAYALLNLTGDHHDLITFDPRGTAEADLFECGDYYDYPSVPGDYLDHEDLNSYILKMKSAAQMCLAPESDHGNITGTGLTARDIMEIVAALGEERLNYWGKTKR